MSSDDTFTLELHHAKPRHPMDPKIVEALEICLADPAAPDDAQPVAAIFNFIRGQYGEVLSPKVSALILSPTGLFDHPWSDIRHEDWAPDFADLVMRVFEHDASGKIWAPDPLGKAWPDDEDQGVEVHLMQGGYVVLPSGYDDLLCDVVQGTIVAETPGPIVSFFERSYKIDLVQSDQS